jgi:hypothetical protein
MNGRSWLALAAVALAGCLASSPPLPPVRWFDPLPRVGEAATPRPACDLRVAAAPHLGREFVVRTAARELVFDPQHGWIAEPSHLVAAALATRLDVAADREPVRVVVETFELDVQAGPRAVVRLVAHARGTSRAIAAEAPAADRSPTAFAAAMAAALEQTADAVAAFVRGD